MSGTPDRRPHCHRGHSEPEEVEHSLALPFSLLSPMCLPWAEHNMAAHPEIWEAACRGETLQHRPEGEGNEMWEGKARNASIRKRTYNEL